MRKINWTTLRGCGTRLKREDTYIDHLNEKKRRLKIKEEAASRNEERMDSKAA